MAAFDVTALLNLGYEETAFHNPMEAQWCAEAVAAAKVTPTAITEKVQFMASLEPYNTPSSTTTRKMTGPPTRKPRAIPTRIPQALSDATTSYS